MLYLNNDIGEPIKGSDVVERPSVRDEFDEAGVAERPGVCEELDFSEGAKISEEVGEVDSVCDEFDPAEGGSSRPAVAGDILAEDFRHVEFGDVDQTWRIVEERHKELRNCCAEVEMSKSSLVCTGGGKSNKRESKLHNVKWFVRLKLFLFSTTCRNKKYLYLGVKSLLALLEHLTIHDSVLHFVSKFCTTSRLRLNTYPGNRIQRLYASPVLKLMDALSNKDLKTIHGLPSRILTQLNQCGDRWLVRHLQQDPLLATLSLDALGLLKHRAERLANGGVDGLVCGDGPNGHCRQRFKCLDFLGR